MSKQRFEKVLMSGKVAGQIGEKAMLDELRTEFSEGKVWERIEEMEGGVQWTSARTGITYRRQEP